MKNMIFRNVLIAVCLLIATNSAKSQIDTAWVTSEHSSQYIYPQLINPEYDPEMTFDNVVLRDINTYGPMNYAGYPLWKIAQKYDVTDSVKLCGVAFISNSMPAAYGRPADALTVRVIDSELNSTIYSKTFLSGGREDGNYSIYTYYPDSAARAYVEVMFDDTIVLNTSYYVSLEYATCSNTIRTEIGMINVKEYSLAHISPQTCVPSGYAPKYRPYFMALGDTEWRDFNDIITNTNPSEIEDLYAHVFSYPNNCDTIVLSPVGICPIKVLENSTSSSVLSVELLERVVRLYPNPANEVLNVACDYDIESIAVFDAVNRLVEERKVNSKTLQLSLANYAQGTYFITITTPKGKLNKKFVVQ